MLNNIYAVYNVCENYISSKKKKKRKIWKNDETNRGYTVDQNNWFRQITFLECRFYNRSTQLCRANSSRRCDRSSCTDRREIHFTRENYPGWGRRFRYRPRRSSEIASLGNGRATSARRRSASNTRSKITGGDRDRRGWFSLACGTHARKIAQPVPVGSSFRGPRDHPPRFQEEIFGSRSSCLCEMPRRIRVKGRDCNSSIRSILVFRSKKSSGASPREIPNLRRPSFCDLVSQFLGALFPARNFNSG